MDLDTPIVASFAYRAQDLRLPRQPPLPLDIRTSIEQERQAIFGDSKRFNLLFLPARSGFESIAEIGSRTTAPRQVMAATMEFQIKEFTSSLFDAEARHLSRYAKDADVLCIWVDDLATDIEALVKRQVSDSRHDFHCSAEKRIEFITDTLDERRTRLLDQKKAELATRAEGPRREESAPTPVKGRILYGPPGNQPDEIEAKNKTASEEVQRRTKLLAGYKAATGNPSNRRIYTSSNSGIHKPQFHEWLRGDLETTSQTSVRFEKFLQAKKRPVPRTPKS